MSVRGQQGLSFIEKLFGIKKLLTAILKCFFGSTGVYMKTNKESI